MTSVGTPEATSCSTFGIRVNFAATAPLSCGGCHVRRGGCALANPVIESAKAAGSLGKGVFSAASLLLCQHSYLSRSGLTEPASSSELASLSQLLLPPL